MSAAKSDSFERLVWFCLGLPAFLAGLWFLEVPALPWTKWLPGGVYLAMAFGIWMGGNRKLSVTRNERKLKQAWLALRNDRRQTMEGRVLTCECCGRLFNIGANDKSRRVSCGSVGLAQTAEAEDARIQCGLESRYGFCSANDQAHRRQKPQEGNV